MVSEVEIVTDPKRIKVGIEETRRSILSLLRIKPMTVAELAEALGKDQSTIYRHVEKLREHTYIEVTEERRVHHIPEKVYSRTAKIFLLSPDKDLVGEDMDMMKKWTRDHAEKLAVLLGRMEGKENVPVENLEELMLAVWDHIMGEVARLKDGGTEVTMRQLHMFQTITVLLHYRSDEEFRRRLDRLLERAGF